MSVEHTSLWRKNLPSVLRNMFKNRTGEAKKATENHHKNLNLVYCSPTIIWAIK